ncbi:hypothetical protein OPV22_006076 [Ensete ventricosum]|uniref:Uncharacterized protein n=1 Tax=Ensete ventricosum TaxID=4639 RepID=A0AAV8RQI3_ENSVE|nr:hypothetical protein OPV22_006076 [Ensete ventricosum]
MARRPRPLPRSSSRSFIMQAANSILILHIDDERDPPGKETSYVSCSRCRWEQKLVDDLVTPAPSVLLSVGREARNTH